MAQAKNIRHDLDPARVKATIEARIAEHEASREYHQAKARRARESYELAVKNGKAHLWPKEPETTADVDRWVDSLIAVERDYYSTVRVIELAPHIAVSGKRFLLVYGDQPDDEVRRGTGPFNTLEEAGNWFFNQGR